MFEKIASNFKKTRQEIKTLHNTNTGSTGVSTTSAHKHTHKRRQSLEQPQQMRDLILTTNTAVDLRREGRGDNPTHSKLRQFSHSSMGTSRSKQNQSFRRPSFSA
jgi:hypothetical protein